MKQILDEFMQYLKEVKRSSSNTVNAYQSDLNGFISYAAGLGFTKPGDFTETMLNSYILSLELSGKKPTTVNRNLVSIRKLILYCIMRGYLHDNPAERIKAPRYELNDPNILSERQIDALLSAPDPTTLLGKRDRAMLELMYATGIKVSELLSLSISDIMMKLSCIHIQGKQERMVPFGKPAADALTTYLLEREKQGANHKLIFITNRNQAMSRQQFWLIIRKYAMQAGIETSITPNTLRNSCAAHMLTNGADCRSVQELLGHTSIQATKRYEIQKQRRARDVYYQTHPRA